MRCCTKNAVNVESPKKIVIEETEDCTNEEVNVENPKKVVIEETEDCTNEEVNVENPKKIVVEETEDGTNEEVNVENPKKIVVEETEDCTKEEVKPNSDLPTVSITLSDGSVYTGTVKDKRVHGRGILKYATGEEYDGEFVDGKRQGKGKWSDKENNSYEGYWENDRRHGHGIYKTADGFTFEGDFNNNKREGKGTIITPVNTKYTCTFQDDVEVGEAEFFFANGDHAIGHIKDGSLSENGRYEFKNGDIYVGSFEKGLFHGEGYYKWNNHTSYAAYEGNYFEGKKHGNGRLINRDGRILCGEFKNNNMNGEFLEISPQGNQTKVLYDHGYFIKILDVIEEKIDVEEFIKETVIHTTIFSDPHMYKKLYEIKKKERPQFRLNLKK
ncbi:phosphatidylinositol-4-phosphate 5-kinase [Plasmodium gonderi]|uniref:Phosphatidylinositol-4-phosphate 5-kinase n=1 Tax=Plasmodium gonderi TaxID=77519 RepID=A0A1Y1JIY9_PLAGO|nr:phosphatidylinositol-4-phosphate 5-kinase [Plasmodium gonderi]GAW82471.1 phosphatidylinositol-4-phosphate 5-kinase [Plasmodium gonderi]